MNTTVGMICFCIFLVFLIGVSIWSAQQNKKGQRPHQNQRKQHGQQPFPDPSGPSPLIALVISH